MSNPFDQFDTPAPTLKERDIEAGITQSEASATSSAASATRTAALLPSEQRKSVADADKAEAEALLAKAMAARGPQLTPQEMETANKKRGEEKRAATVNSMLGEVRRLYDQDIKGQPITRAFGAAEYIDSLPNNERFTAASNAILPLIRPLVAQSAKEGDSDKEMQVFQAYIPSNDDSDQTIEQKFKMLEMLIGGMVDGRPPSEVLAAANRRDDDAAIASTTLPPDAGSPSPTDRAPPPLSDSGTPMQVAQGDVAREVDAKLQSELDAMLRRGASYQEINEHAMRSGGEPINRQQYGAVRAFLRKNPDYAGSLVSATKYKPLTPFEKVTTAVGDNPVGAYLLGAGQFLSGNTLDNLSSDPERANLSLDMLSAKYPNATAVGNVSGGILAGLTGEAALARLGVAPGLLRGAVTDMTTGGLSAAGDAEGGNRLSAAGIGSLESIAGGILGTGASKGLSKAISPSGGTYRELYEAGVRPTIGQRFSNVNDGRGIRGVAGAAVNKTEEALQSIPIVGSAIRGARDEARDQFQIGAFNEALREIGEELPKGTRPGNVPHQIAQKAFSDAYDKARSGMTLYADEQLANDFAALADDIGSLGPEMQARLQRIMDNRVNNHMRGGGASGESYKKIISGLNRQIGLLSKNPDAQDLASIVSSVKFSIENAARRHSDPAAVELLDAADAGYAKLVRLEDAAARRGGDTGTFSPAQLDAAVQKTSGGVRSKAYLRGDALLQDYAAAGRGLEDKVPNSGTVDRALTVGGTAVPGAAIYAAPMQTLALLGAIGTAYAPGVRKLVKASMAPSGPRARAIAAQLEKRAQLAGRVGAGTSAALLPETSPPP